jgi:hypothetical protein
LVHASPGDALKAAGLGQLEDFTMGHLTYTGQFHGGRTPPFCAFFLASI